MKQDGLTVTQEALIRSLTGFNASNSDGEALGGLRLITLEFNVETALAEVMVITAGVSKILSIVGTSMPTADRLFQSLSLTQVTMQTHQQRLEALYLLSKYTQKQQ